MPTKQPCTCHVSASLFRFHVCVCVLRFSSILTPMLYKSVVKSWAGETHTCHSGIFQLGNLYQFGSVFVSRDFFAFVSRLFLINNAKWKFQSYTRNNWIKTKKQKQKVRQDKDLKLANILSITLSMLPFCSVVISFRWHLIQEKKIHFGVEKCKLLQMAISLQCIYKIKLDRPLNDDHKMGNLHKQSKSCILLNSNHWITQKKNMSTFKDGLEKYVCRKYEKKKSPESIHIEEVASKSTSCVCVCMCIIYLSA